MSTLGAQNQADGFREDQQIQHNPGISEVVQVIAQLDAAITHAVAIGIVDLRLAA